MSYYNTVNKMRLSGLVSGMDTDTLVKYSTRLQQNKIDKQNATKTKMQWKIDAYNDINSALRTFRDKYMSVLNQKTNLMSSLNYNTYKVDYTSPDNAFTVTAGNSASTSYLQVVSVDQVVRGSYINGARRDNYDVSAITDDTTLEQAGVKSDNGTITVTVDGIARSFTYDKTDTIGDIKQRLGANFTFDYDKTAKAFKLGYNGTGTLDALTDTAGSAARDLGLSGYGSSISADGKQLVGAARVYGDITWNTTLANAGVVFEGASNTGSVLINGIEVEYSKYDTIASFAQRVGEKTGGKASFVYDQVSKTFTIEAAKREDGFGKLVVQDKVGNAFKDLGLINAGQYSAEGSTAQEARITVMDINGVTRTYTSGTNEFTIDGLHITLNHKTAQGAAPVNIKVTQDVEPVYNLVTEMVDAYNELYTKLQKYAYDTPNRKYTPLTDELKSGMTEKEIEEWEGLAKAGILRNDSAVTGLMSELRGIFFAPTYNLGDIDNPDRKGNTLASFGIQTSFNFSTRTGGQLEIDSAKLKKALADDPDAVMNAFMQNVNYNPLVADDDKYSYNGAMTRMQNFMSKFDVDVSAGLISPLKDKIRRAENDIYTLEVAMYKKQEYYYQRFAAMEKALQNMNSQSTWIGQQLGMSSGS